MKKTIAVLCSAALVISLIPARAMAESLDSNGSVIATETDELAIEGDGSEEDCLEDEGQAFSDSLATDDSIDDSEAYGEDAAAQVIPDSDLPEDVTQLEEPDGETALGESPMGAPLDETDDEDPAGSHGPLPGTNVRQAGQKRLAHWTRLSGNNALDTMRKIVQADGIFKNGRGGTVVIATANGYKDALCATGLAGRLDAPVLITPGGALASQTKAEIQRLKPTRIVVVGGTRAISAKTFNSIKALCNNTVREYGRNAADTAVAVYRYGYGWSSTAIVATSDSYKDALSIAPYSYAKGAPIFLCNSSKTVSKRTLSSNTLNAITNGGFTRVIIVGGTKAVPDTVRKQLSDRGISVQRIAGKTATETSALIGNWELRNGMTATHEAVATTAGYKDALCGAALAGKQNSILMLVNKTGFSSKNYGVYYSVVFSQLNVSHGHILGGTSVISAKLFRQVASTYGMPSGKYKVSGGMYGGWTINFYSDGSLGAVPKGGSQETRAGIWYVVSDPWGYFELDGHGWSEAYPENSGKTKWDGFFNGVLTKA